MKKIFLLTVFIFILSGMAAYAEEKADVNAMSVLQDGEWIYYNDRFKNNISMVKTDGTMNTVLCEGYYNVYDQGDI